MTMEIPRYFGEKMSRIFGEAGRRWVEALPGMLAKCIEKWQLTEVSFVEGLSVNLICFAKSAEYGQVVLKLEGPHPEGETEMQALALYGGRQICRVYEQDRELRALLLERFWPGDDLTSVESREEQLRIAAELIGKLPIPVEEGHGLPTYGEWVKRAWAWARQSEKVGPRMLALVEAAEELFGEIEALDRPQVLLHGDLHHWNILRDSEEWKAIDPQGVVGMRCLESARFMNNHFDVVPEEERLEHLDQMVTVFAEEFGEAKRVVASCLLVLYVLSTIWTFQEASPDPENLERLMGECEVVLGYVGGMPATV